MSGAPIGALLARLERVKQTGLGQWRARCPAHESKGLTLSIGEADSGAALVHCFAGCGAADVLASVGLQLSDLYPPDGLIEARRYDTRPRRNLRQVIDGCKPSATLVQVYVTEMMRPKTWQVLAGALNLDKRDLWVLQGAAQDLRRLLDA
ncbi:MAG: hypothetical protein QF734_09835 [Arenicellales bacterium]|nr:hypothetical protein [Arenicellales bacterium]